MQNETLLILEDATFFAGTSFAHPACSLDELDKNLALNLPRGMGELIFTTAMSGYVEYMTDPSYTGQIITATYPLVGNYGVSAQWSESNNETKKDAIAPAALVIHELYRGPVIQNRKTLEQWMVEQSVPGIEGIDTRALTKYIRDRGAKNAAVVSLLDKDASEIQRAAEIISRMPAMEGRNIVSNISSTWQEHSLDSSKLCTVLLYNCGTKKNIIDLLLDRHCHVIVAPSNASAEDILKCQADMVLVSNGPGDPAVLQQQLDVIRELHEKTVLCGICLGNQLLALSLGAKTYKMLFGHHGSNHPVQELKSSKLYITSQNHGFSIDEDSLPEDAEVWFRNTNDNSIEGFHHQKKNIYSVQFHPEARPGPVDSAWIFDFFIDKAIQFREGKRRSAFSILKTIK